MRKDIIHFFREIISFYHQRIFIAFTFFEKHKSAMAGLLYRQRGRFSRRFIHTGMAGITAFSVVVTPMVTSDLTEINEGRTSQGIVLLMGENESYLDTEISDKLRDKIMEYTIQEGDTLSLVAKKFGISTDTIRWQNKLTSKNPVLKPGQKLEILPVTGVSHKVVKGDTVYSLAKKYDTSAQAIVDFPFNTFTNDETFALAIGQVVIVPDGIKDEASIALPTRYALTTPDAGSVTALGSFVWPTAGVISQRYSWFHKGLDIANRNGPSIVAADSGKVIVAGWPDASGYGNRVLIDHQNGYVTLYAHLSQINVSAGQSVARGNLIGKMGSTGRSTGTHLHLEIIKNGVKLNPLEVLK